MAVLTLNMFEPALGKLFEGESLLREILEIATGLGAQGQLLSLARGGVPNTLAIDLEYDDTEAYGAAMDQIYADEGFQQFMKRAVESEALTPTRSVDYVELPGFEAPFEQLPSSGGVLVATVFQVRAGKQEQSLQRIGRAKALFEKHGGTFRAMQSVASDPFGLTATATYYENFTAWGAAGKALTADPEFQAFGAEIQGVDASSDFLRTSVYRIL